jgi:hypothetical protein
MLRAYTPRAASDSEMREQSDIDFLETVALPSSSSDDNDSDEECSPSSVSACFGG